MSISSVVIGCADVPSSVEFYQTFLRAEVIGEPTADGADLDLVTGTIRLRRARPPVPDSTWEPDDLQRGFRHVGFKVAAVDPLAERLRAAGVRFHLDPLDAHGGVRICFFYDPDGTLLEFVAGDLDYTRVLDAAEAASERALGVPDRPRLDHVATTVSDRDATAELYRRNAGFTPVGTLEQPDDSRGFGIEYLRAGATVLEVFTYRAATHPRAPQPEAAGFRYAILSPGAGTGLEQVSEADGGVHADPDGFLFAIGAAR